MRFFEGMPEVLTRTETLGICGIDQAVAIIVGAVATAVNLSLARCRLARARSATGRGFWWDCAARAGGGDAARARRATTRAAGAANIHSASFEPRVAAISGARIDAGVLRSRVVTRRLTARKHEPGTRDNGLNAGCSHQHDPSGSLI
jgi:hypothetical protein